MSLASRILQQFKQQISGLELEPSSGGCFELTADGDLLYSKLQTGEFPNEDSLLETLQQRL